MKIFGSNLRPLCITNGCTIASLCCCCYWRMTAFSLYANIFVLVFSFHSLQHHRYIPFACICVRSAAAASLSKDSNQHFFHLMPLFLSLSLMCSVFMTRPHMTEFINAKARQWGKIECKQARCIIKIASKWWTNKMKFFIVIIFICYDI